MKKSPVSSMIYIYFHIIGGMVLTEFRSALPNFRKFNRSDLTMKTYRIQGIESSELAHPHWRSTKSEQGLILKKNLFLPLITL